MGQEWLLELVKVMGKFFLNPVLYFTVILVMAAGLIRIKRERKDFHVRVNDIFHELKLLFPAGILAGAILSILSFSTGFVVPFEMIVLIGIFTIILGAAGNGRLLSPAWTAGVPFLLVYAIDALELQVPYIHGLFEGSPLLTSLPILLGILLLTEGILMQKDGLKDISPKLRTSPRGLTVGALQVKRIWMLPIFFLLPAGPLPPPFEWWPVFDWDNASYSFLFIPFTVGFQNQVQSCLPSQAVERMARKVKLLGIVVLGGAAAGFFYPEYTYPIITGIAIVGRALISYLHRVRENNTLYYFTPRNKGLMVLDTIPGSPASKMELKTGEIIQSCNNMPISNKEELYKALLKNRAYCKLEVIDVNGEIRFEQCALYEGDHHELGILSVEKRKKREPGEAM
ncbi:PDZ domain-containing protein [Siminovitchia sediminis]|uniref:PDZ domain-containing protein n=1 Tax=Siminovitchia sediminis TaxID=1274353 RepID=A0ABW4KHL9_9BACI